MSILNDSLLRLYNSKRITLDRLQKIYDRGNITKEDFYAIAGQYPSEKPISDQATEEDYKSALTELGVNVNEETTA